MTRLLLVSLLSVSEKWKHYKFFFLSLALFIILSWYTQHEDVVLKLLDRFHFVCRLVRDYFTFLRHNHRLHNYAYATDAWARRGVYRAIPAVTRNLDSHVLIRRNTLFSIFTTSQGYRGLIWLLYSDAESLFGCFTIRHYIHSDSHSQLCQTTI